MKFLRRQQLKEKFEPPTEIEIRDNISKFKKARNVMIGLGIVGLSVTIGVDVANGDQEARRLRHDANITNVEQFNEATSWGETKNEVAPYIPALFGIVSLLAAAAAQSQIVDMKHEAEDAHLREAIVAGAPIS